MRTPSGTGSGVTVRGSTADVAAAAELGEPEPGGQRAGARLVDRAGPRRRHADRREVVVGRVRERGADPLAAPARVDGDHQGAAVRLRDPPLVARGAPADDLAALVPGEHQELGPLRDVLEPVAHALGGDDRVRPGPLAHRRGARNVVECALADHGGTLASGPRRTWPDRRRRSRLASTRDRHAARGAPRRPQSCAAGGGAPRRRTAPRRGGGGVGQDARPHAPRRAPDPRARREAERDPRDHVHEQGRRGDARAARADARPHRAGDLDPHVPRRLRPHPAARGRAARLPLVVHDLRPGGPGPGRQGVPRGAREGSEALHAARHPLADLEREEPAHLARGVRVARRVVLGPDRRGGVRAVPAAALRLERGRLRRHADADRAGARALPGGAGALADDVPPRPRRRVPGHEPRPVPAAAAARGEAPERVRGGRPRPVASTRSEAPTSGTSSTSSGTSAARGSSRSSRTTARRMRSSRRPTR